MNSLGPPTLGVGHLPDVGLVGRARTWSEVGLQQPMSASSDPGVGPVAKQKRQRSANWTLEEELTLVSLYRDLEKQFETKKQLWEQLAQLLQERGGFERKPLSLEQKWGNMIQSYRSIKEHDRTKVHVANKFFSLPFEERKALLQTWKVNNLDDKTFDSMDEFLKDRDRGTPLHSAAQPHSGGHHSITHPAPHHHTVPIRHIEVNYLQPNNILGSVANTILVKMVDAERYFAKTAAHDVEKCKQYLTLLKECSTVFREIKDNMVAMPAANGGLPSHLGQQQQQQYGAAQSPQQHGQSLPLPAPPMPGSSSSIPPASTPLAPPTAHRHMQQQQQPPLPHHPQSQQAPQQPQQQQQQPPPAPQQPQPPQQPQALQQQQQHHMAPAHQQQPQQGHLQQPPHSQLLPSPGAPPPPPQQVHQQHQQGQRHPV